MGDNAPFLMRSIEGYNYISKKSPLYEYDWDNWYKFSDAPHIITIYIKNICHPIDKMKDPPDKSLEKLPTKKTRDDEKLREQQASHTHHIPFSD